MYSKYGDFFLLVSGLNQEMAESSNPLPTLENLTVY